MTWRIIVMKYAPTTQILQVLIIREGGIATVQQQNAKTRAPYIQSGP